MHHSIRQPESKEKLFELEIVTIVFNLTYITSMNKRYFLFSWHFYIQNDILVKNFFEYLQIDVVFRKIQTFCFWCFFVYNDFYVGFCFDFENLRNWVNFIKVVSSHRWNMHSMWKKSRKSPTFINIHWTTADKPNLWIQFKHECFFSSISCIHFAIEKLFTAFANFSTMLTLSLQDGLEQNV